jgi:hypothetical protein
VTIRGTGFGTARGKVEFSYGRNGVMRISATDVVSWSDTAIDCAVPTGLIDKYPASAGTGPVVVSDALGRESNAYAFTVGLSQELVPVYIAEKFGMRGENPTTVKLAEMLTAIRRRLSE